MWGRKSSKSFLIHAQMIKKNGERSIKLSLRSGQGHLRFASRVRKPEKILFSEAKLLPSGINIAAQVGMGKSSKRTSEVYD